MAELKPEIKNTVVSSEAARVGWADIMGRVQYAGERFVVTRNRQPAVAIVPLADLEKLPPAA